MLEAELETFCHWFFLDVADSFAGILDHTEDILVVYKRSKMRWGTEITVSDLLGEDGQGKLISEMKQAGCMLIYLGIESIFRPIHGKVDRERTETVIRRCRKEGIITIGSLIFDITGKEMQEEIEETIHWATKWLDFAQFSLLALLPGCDLRIKALRDGNIIENDWRKFDGAHPTIKHPLSPEQRSQLLTRAYQEFSTFPNILRRALRAQEITAGVAVFCGGLRYRKGIPQF